MEVKCCYVCFTPGGGNLLKINKLILKNGALGEAKDGNGNRRVEALTNLASSTSSTTSSLSSLSLSSNSCWSLQGGVKGQTREGSKR